MWLVWGIARAGETILRDNSSVVSLLLPMSTLYTFDFKWMFGPVTFSFLRVMWPAKMPVATYNSPTPTLSPF
jgi:hypothetical protein